MCVCLGAGKTWGFLSSESSQPCGLWFDFSKPQLASLQYGSSALTKSVYPAPALPHLGASLAADTCHCREQQSWCKALALGLPSLHTQPSAGIWWWEVLRWRHSVTVGYAAVCSACVLYYSCRFESWMCHLLMQLLINVSKAQKIVVREQGSLPPMWETGMELQALGFVLVQPCLLWASGGAN